SLDERYPHRIDCLSQGWELTGMVFSPRGDRLISSSQDGTIKIWRSFPP
ncbi:MAG: hypothetical protein F6K09_13300, partial [Merismopedia sp. SIO2A8]|nr:hypothetical protein [Merismopedia sp. SIO2A8]